MDFSRRSAIGSTVAAVAVVVIIVAALAGYFALTSSSTKTTTSSVESSVAYTTTATYCPQASSSTNSSTVSGGSFPFNFTLNHVSQAIVSPGGYSVVVTVSICHPSEQNGEAVYLNGTAPPGFTVGFLPNSPVLVPATQGVTVTLDVSASTNVALGNDTIQISGSSGPESQTASFTIKVVQYRVTMVCNRFDEPTINVTAGSTVYWQNLDGPGTACPASVTGNGDHNVVFTTLPVNSSTVQQFGIFSHTFATPGSFPYYSSLQPDHSMNGTINVVA